MHYRTTIVNTVICLVKWLSNPDTSKGHLILPGPIERLTLNGSGGQSYKRLETENPKRVQFHFKGRRGVYGTCACRLLLP